MAIQKLPQYLINKLKAGEIVERPASVVKELLENSLDAGATAITVTINDGGKSLIQIADNGSGISIADLPQAIEPFATSKIFEEADLASIESYGFRGEALASIAEVSKVTIQTKTQASDVAYKLSKLWPTIDTGIVSVPFEHGTVVTVEDLFYNTPARLKFLKTGQTEYLYIHQLFSSIALANPHVVMTLVKDGKTVFDLGIATDLTQRIGELYKPDRISKLNALNHQEENLVISGYVSDPSLHFGSAEHIKIRVNGRPVQDRIIKKAVMSAYQRQLHPGDHPFALITVTIAPDLVDVNVHPRKLEVRFLDPQHMYQAAERAVTKTLGQHKITTVQAFDSGASSGNSGSFSNNFQRDFGGAAGNQRVATAFSSPRSKSSYQASSFNTIARKQAHSPSLDLPLTHSISTSSSIDYMPAGHEIFTHFQLLGQLRQSYILLQSNDSLYLVDQHALAERIAFEKLKKIALTTKLQPSPILTPIKVSVSKSVPIDDQVDALNYIGFDVSQLGNETIVVYAVPSFLSEYNQDLSPLIDNILHSDAISLENLIDTIYATKACKASIKAGQKLSFPEMEQLLQDGFDHIDQMFVCQHGRPFFIQMDKGDIGKLFDRT